jgi:hypothetical protein
LRGNVYGWFVPVERGVYTLAESGRAALLRWPQPAPPTQSINEGSGPEERARNQRLTAHNLLIRLYAPV